MSAFSTYLKLFRYAPFIGIVQQHINKIVNMVKGVIVPVSRDELKDIICNAVRDAMKGVQTPIPKVVKSDTLLKITEISRLLKVSNATIHKWKKEGKIPFHRISNRIFFKESEVLECLRKVNQL